MGYRSEVAFRIEAQNENDIQTIVEKLKNKWTAIADYQWEDFILDIKIVDNQLTMHGDYLKWYETYEDVNAVMEWFWALVDDYNENDDTVIKGLQYMRIGEDPEDVEEIWHGDLNNPMSLIRTIDLD